MGKLTKAQMHTLKLLAVSDASAYGMGVGLGTLNALSLKGMARIIPQPGNMAFPRNAMWAITPAGRAALKERSNET